MAFDDVLNATNGLAFKPVRTTEKKLGTDICPIRNGYMYFTTDTQKIYMGTNEGKALPMGGNSGIYYGHRQLSEDETNIEITQLEFSAENDIDGDQTPNVDDLILNIPDGGFYRVTSVFEDEVIGLKIAMSGSGSGGGSGGGTPTSDRPKIQLSNEISYFEISNPENMKIKYTCSSNLNDGFNYISHITYRIGSTRYEEDVQYYFDTETGLTQEITLDVSKYLNNISIGSVVTIKVTVEDYYGNISYDGNARVYLIELRLINNVSKFSRIDINNLSENIYRYDCVPQGGGGNDLINRRILWQLLDENNNQKKVGEKVVESINSNMQIDIDCSDLEHGVYKLIAQYEVTISTTGKTVRSKQEKVILGIYRVVEGQLTQPLILTDFEEQSIQQYEPYILNYFILDSSANDYSQVEINFIAVSGINTENIGNEKPPLNTQTSWSYSFLNTGTYTLFLNYNGKEYELGNLNIIKYMGNAPVLNFNDIDYSLSAAGRSNNEVNRDKWYSKGKNKTSAVLENFLWSSNSGWIKDADGETALKISNGAKLTISGKDFPILESQGGYINGTSGLLIEFDVRFENVSDYSKSLIECISYKTKNEINAGFCLTGQKATLNTTLQKPDEMEIGGETDEETGNVNEQDAALQALTQYYNEGQRIHLAYSIPKILPRGIGTDPFYFITTYLNGVLSGISKITITTTGSGSFESVQDFDSSNPASLICDSTYGDIYLYNFRVTRNQLEPQEIVKRYIADYENMTTRVDKWKTNNLFGEYANKISLAKIKEIANELQIPYVLMRGGIEINKKFDESFVFNSSNPGYRLPYTKSDYRLMSIEMYYKNSETPIYSVPIEVEDSNDSSKTYKDFGSIPTGNYKVKRGVQVYGQGTSSMVYPVKNLRFKFAQEQDFPVVYNGIEVGPEIIKNNSSRVSPVEIVCLKADYMDSSSSHNTQTANLIYDLYSNMNMKTPPQASELYGKDLVTAIRGYPIICFFTDNNSESNYTYIGRYNFNLDKATPEPFGFIPKINGNKSLGYEIDSEGNLVLDEEGNPHDIVQCWEFLNNNTGSPTKFLTDKDNYGTFEDNMRNAWWDYFEDRYPDAFVGAQEDGELTARDQQDIENGLFRMACWVNSTARPEATNNSLGEKAAYYLTRDSEPDLNKNYYLKINDIYELVNIEKKDNIESSYSNIYDQFAQNLTNIVVDWNIFIQKIGTYGLYTYSYVVDDLNNEYWWDGSQEIGNNLNDFGISYSGIPSNGDSITINYSFLYQGWNPSTLYEYYTIDNEDYRLAKFYDEFEDYFNKEFSLFYYVLTLVLLMMDSRAKNMMLASWDQKIWYPIFYDMDTMLGINNTGFNKFSFDVEDINNTVFNAYDSVLWNNFRDVFKTDIANMYNRMRSSGLTIEQLLRRYNELSADAWNESLTTADALYKYEIPYLEGYYDGSSEDGIIEVKPGEVNYLYAGQGKRSNHRAWWLSNRLNYFDSEFISYSLGSNKPTAANTFSFRAYSSPEQSNSEAALACTKAVPPSHEFTLTALNNSYQAIMVGNIIYRSQDVDTENGGLIQANKTIKLGPKTAKHEVESWILNPYLIADLGDLSNKYLGSWKFPSQPTKLTELKFGQTPRSHPSTYNVYYNTLLLALDITDKCPLLKSINIGKCTKLKALDLSQCYNLETVDAYKSGLTALTLPEGSIVKELYLPLSLKELYIGNQPYLSVIEFDDGSQGEHLDIVSLKSVYINTYDLVYNMINNNDLSNYLLEDIKWEITESSNNHVSYDENGYITGINLLDILQAGEKAKPLNNTVLKNALTGEIKISIPGGKVKEYDLYKKYVKNFPNITFVFDEENMVITKANKITFLKDQDGEIEYQVLTDGNYTLNELVYNSSVTGTTLTKNPTKNPTDAETFKFTNYWIDANTGNKYYYEETSEAGVMDFDDIRPTSDMIFYPEFEPQKRYYSVTFRDINNNKISQGTMANGSEIYDFQVGYGEKYTGPILNYYITPESTVVLSEHERITFKGWTNYNYNNTNVNIDELEFIDPTNLIVYNKVELWPYYIIENATKVASNSWYFNIEGNKISINDIYRDQLEGKITLPADSNLTIVGDFVGIVKVTDVYFQEGNSYKEIANEAFNNTNEKSVLNPSPLYDMALKSVYLPNSIEIIGEYAFTSQNKLEFINIANKVELPQNLASIKQYAFAKTNIAFTKLPDNVSFIGYRAFVFNNALKITQLPISLKGLSYAQSFYNCDYFWVTTFGHEDLESFVFGNSNALQSTGRAYDQKDFTLTLYNDIQGPSGIFKTYLSLNNTNEEHNVYINWYVETISDAEGDKLLERADSWFGTAATLVEFRVYGKDGTYYDNL